MPSGGRSSARRGAKKRATFSGASCPRDKRMRAVRARKPTRDAKFSAAISSTVLNRQFDDFMPRPGYHLAQASAPHSGAGLQLLRTRGASSSANFPLRKARTEPEVCDTTMAMAWLSREIPAAAMCRAPSPRGTSTSRPLSKFK